MNSKIVEGLLGVPYEARDCVRTARIARYGLLIWIGIVGFALIGLPAPSLGGEGLVMLVGLLVLIATVVYEVRRNPETVVTRAAVGLALGLASAMLASVSSTGTAILGCYAAVGMSARALPRRAALVVTIPIVAATNAVLIAGADALAITLLWSNFGFLSTFLIAQLGRLGEERTRRAQELLAEEQRTRDARAEAARLGERGRIAREMHDVLAHSLSALTVQLEGARLLAADRGADPDVQRAIERSHRHARTGLAEAREAIEALRGDSLPGPERLRDLAAEFGADEGLPCEFELQGEPHPLSSQARLALYRIGQEALTNVRKHALAERVDVRLRYDPEGTTLVVADHHANGRGNGSEPRPLADAGSGYGVSGMRERAELLGGRLSAGHTADGFRVELWLPAEAEAAG